MNAVALAFLLLAGRLQDDGEARPFTIPKQERSSYVPALQKFRDAEGLLGDPLECAKRCGELLDDKSVREIHRDAMLRIQNTDGSYGDWALYAPHQLRGRALLTYAESLAPRDRKEAAKQARLAAADLEESVRRKLKSSEPLYERARKLSDQLKDVEPVPNERLAEAERRLVEIRTLRDQKAPPESVLEKCESAAPLLKGTPYEEAWRLIRSDAFQARWAGHADAGRFRSARASVASLGGFLTEAERKDVLGKIDERSRDWARRFQASLRDLLPDQDTWAAFVRVPLPEIERRLAVPVAEELGDPDGALIWARGCRERLLQARATAALPAGTLEDFLKGLNSAAQACVEATGQIRESENRAFAALEALVQDLALVRLEKNLAGAFTEESEGLGRRRDESRRIVETMERFAGLVEKNLNGPNPVVSRHLAQIRSTADKLPIDPPRLDEIGRKLLDPSEPKGLWGRTPDLAQEFETELTELDRAQGPRLSRTARRKLSTYFLVSGTARLLLAGGRVEEVARREELKTLARKLEADGGPLPEVMALVSPRVRAVWDLLKP